MVSCLPFTVNRFIVQYANYADSTVRYLLQRLLTICETDLKWFDVTIIVKKPCCIGIGPRYISSCVCLKTACGITLPRELEVGYLRTFIISSSLLKCSLGLAKKAFYRDAN